MSEAKQKHLLQSDEVTESLLKIYEMYPLLWHKPHANFKNTSLKDVNLREIN